jgi:hypothetical protein
VTFRTIACVSCVAAVALGCSKTEPSARSQAEAPGRAARSWTAFGDDAALYLAVIESLRVRPAVEGRSPLRIADSVYWWPFVEPSGARRALGPVPVDLRHQGTGAQPQSLSVGPLEELVTRDGRVQGSGPVLVLGPIDYAGLDEAVVRVSVYLGPNGQSLYRIHLRRVNGGWQAQVVQVELQS